jgi:Fe-S-cluster containining protein
MKRSRKKEWRSLLHFRCTGCATCCTETVVPVTDQDVARIMKATKQEAGEVVRFFFPDDVKGERRSPAWIKLRQGKRFMGLRKTRGHCRYLEEGRCRIYPHRPVTCRLYPFNIFFDDDGEVESLEINDAVKCQYALGGNVSLEEIKALYYRDEEQDAAYFAKVKEWNAVHPKGTANEFLVFLGLAGERGE